MHDDDDETFRRSPAAQGESQDKGNRTSYSKKPQADPGCISVKTTVLQRGNLWTRSCGLDSKTRRTTTCARLVKTSLHKLMQKGSELLVKKKKEELTKTPHFISRCGPHRETLPFLHPPTLVASPWLHLAKVDFVIDRTVQHQPTIGMLTVSDRTEQHQPTIHQQYIRMPPTPSAFATGHTSHKHRDMLKISCEPPVSHTMCREIMTMSPFLNTRAIDHFFASSN